jgi:lipooligosaccharide transport system permease protein
MSNPVARICAVFELQLRFHLRTWRGGLFSAFVLPLIVTYGFGLAFGDELDAHALGGAGYVAFLIPGVLAATIFEIAVGESTWPVWSRFTWIGTYHALRATPLRISDIILGHYLFVVLRALVVATVYVAVVAALGFVPARAVLAVWPPCAGIAVAIAAPATALGALVDNDSWFPVVQRAVVLPLTLTSGVFFPLAELPPVCATVAALTPLWHGVEITRAAVGNATDGGTLVHWLVLLAWAVPGYAVCHIAFSRRLAT